MKRLIIAVLCAVSCTVAAQDTGEGGAPAAETRTPEQLSAQAAELRAEAARIRSGAEAEHAASRTACWKKFLVSACLEQADERARAARQEAKRIEIEAGRMERHARQLERDDRVRRRQEDKAAEIERRRIAGD